ncbi:glutathione transferase GstA [Moellerella wisconsensis]|uniref:Glutathione S-transferase n=1 Tax=Moellerella wisconsensis ATCC 35017 TaxID=1354267 RepID=A0A0N0Z7B5_9GAMM|nr:glutathione transferase GstA [Moellerella wisconsensis]KPD02437.1 glutathione S-transferase [Moellerella wisconsensis ATCC 35017]VFS53804.1 Glutathione S-transferase GST-6.0 [Moellerella wisconsensis]
MKLYYSPGACSLSPHIILREAGIDFSIERVDLKTKTTEHGVDFNTINPKGQVPFLVLDSGDTLSEGAVIVQYIADQTPARNLIAEKGTLQRYHQLEMLNYISTELHKSFAPLFTPGTPEEYKHSVRTNLLKKFAYLDKMLAQQNYICGEHFTVADAYLFTVGGWNKLVGIDISALHHLQNYLAKITQRPEVQKALQIEGLI